MATSYSALCVILSLQQVLCAQNFTAVEWSVQTSSSSQCKTPPSSSELTSAISTVAQMIANTVDYLPQSCLEVKNGSPESPSGYYTVMNDNSGVATIVYCDMDNLSSCFDLEQSLTGIMSSVGTLTSVVSGLHIRHENLSVSVSGVQAGVDSLQTGVDNLQTGLQANYGALNASVSGVQAGVDSLQTGLQVNYEALNASIYSLQTDFEDFNASVSGVQDSIDNLQTDFDAFQFSYFSTSCESIKSNWPLSPSGWYKISSEDVYCYMEDRCGMAGPWTRVLYLNMTDPSQTCPGDLQLYNSGGVRACGRPQGSSGCASIFSSNSSLSYSKICGKVIGYQFYSPDNIRSGTIDDVYVDGVSITRGSPQQHVWTLVNQLTGSVTSCPCSGGGNLPSFVGNDYYCESGNPLGSSWSPVFYADDPLWDGQGCTGGESDCCANPDLPWFHKDVTSSTTDYIELRICGDEDTVNEDTPVSLYEIYVQ